jgi:outer membrane immunogenic protein
MQKTLMTAALATMLGGAGSALAADLNSGGMKDLAYLPAPVWSGFYIGLNGGYGENGTSPDLTSYIDSTAIATSEGFASKGAFGGAQAGYNVQRGRFVAGIETDLQMSGLQSSKDVLTDSVYLTRHLEQNVNWLGSIRGRAGFTFGNALAYATGGFAYAGIDTKVVSSLLSAIPVAHYGRTGVDAGYTAGGGVEYQISPAWSAKAEYQYIDLGAAALSGTYVAGAITSNDLENTFHTVRLGFNYRLGGGMADMPLK